MFYLFLKFILAVFLTAIPFVFHYLVKPKSAESPKWKNSIALGINLYPAFKRKKRKFTAWILRVYHRMKFSQNARMFFIFSFVLLMLAVQICDYNMSNCIYSDIVKASQGSVAYKASVFPILNLGNFYFMYSQVTPFIVCIVSLFISTLFFHYSFSDYIFTKIHNNKWLKFTIGGTIIVVAVLSLGRLFLVSELLYLILLAGIVYPNFDFGEYTKWRKRLYHYKTRSSVYPTALTPKKMSA